ncbi:IclR family transcriptional regulator [Cupriavidus basilensis]|uniref:IclR family transcriptional regulator n=1 Tax=Cupriavidus basilensis TaxID=68895 RepID=UPI0023E82D47|nr:IclR family transcriptional regulator [Cupriavidus basilensis]MDF3883014.1 IclR family transcriptional regulator [Cupriavidus basilensis]
MKDMQASAGGVQAVLFALQILEYLAGNKEAVRITDLAKHFDTNKNRIFRHLRTLIQLGYIVQEGESERYRVGTRLIALGHAVSENFDLTRMASGPMKVLRDKLNHSVVLSLAGPDGAHVISVLPGTAPIEIIVKPGSVLGFHWSAQGKVTLAYAPALVKERVLSSLLEAHTTQTIVDAAALQAELVVIRSRGWAVAPNEAALGLNTLAAPIFDASGVMIGAIAIVDLVQSIGAEPSEPQLAAVLEAARTTSENIGYKGAYVAKAA